MSIEFRNVSLSYAAAEGKVEALRGLSWEVETGGFAAVMGHTGSGKSTLLRLLCALVKPDSGQILIDGKDIHSSLPRRELRKEMGFVFQFPEYQLFETTVLKEVCFGMKNLGFPKAKMEENSKWAIEKMGFDFEAVKGVSPFALSGGQRRRVAIASVLASRPKILLLDEPTSGLDPAERRIFCGILKSLNREGTTIIMVSHNSEVVCETAEALLVLKDGEKWKEGKVKDLFSSDLSPAGILPPPALALSSFLQKRGLDLPCQVKDEDFIASLKEAARRRKDG
ncbi:MAG: energy-coupling factor transporter ATPase [Aeriscardovia sp.]|nr:energy-coupling factor transporter ATPase [Aeriscardovia sp.]